jgi:hypothetical protein
MASSIRIWTYILWITSMKQLNFLSSTCFFARRGNVSRCVSLMSLGEALPRFPSSFSGLISTSTSTSSFSSTLIRWTHLPGFCFGFSYCLPGLSNHSLHIFLGGDSQLTREISAIWMLQCCNQLCYPHLQHFVEVQLVLDYHYEVVHLTVDAFQDPIIGK